MSECRTCQWWLRDEPERNVCVLLTGMNDCDTAKLAVKSKGAIRTSPDFGCVLHMERTER